MSKTESYKQVSLSFDRGTLLLTGPTRNQLPETCGSYVWRWDTRVGAWRCDAIYYAAIREGEILHDRQKTFVPDFTFRHEDGTEVLLEIVGFWTPEYLAHRRETLQQFRQHRILIAVPEKSLREGTNIGENVLVYKTALKLGPLMEALEKTRKPKT